ncbi:PaaI family thioesterase [Corynebacterium choanae]|uniref:Esterase n=1 Tax=Corynebacterium choanae TaxID=1862358 RepID=A0A3G6J6D7_9CORY|nr:PaaI family thioesterase [Corynebacterium choanae]AZA13516.1 Putative esterase [Corynebacterium choanae]
MTAAHPAATTIMNMLTNASKQPVTADELLRFHAALAERGLEGQLGITYQQISAEAVVAAMKVTDSVIQPFGLLHGGAIAALVESVASVAGIVASGSAVAGLNNHTEFIRPATSGVVTATATVQHCGATTQSIAVHIVDEQQRLIATGHVRTMVLAPQVQ